MKKIIFILILSITFFQNTWALNFSSDFYNYDKLNFGVVVLNDVYQIYRSGKLNEDGLEDLYEHLEENKLPFPKTIIYMNHRGYKWNLFWNSFALDEYLGQSQYGYTFYHSFDYDYRTYLDGHNPYDPQEDIDMIASYGEEAEELLGPRQLDGKNDGDIEALMRILNLVLDPSKQPVLFHCFGGMHRTGMIGMIVRYLQGGEWLSGKKRKVYVGGFEFRDLNPAQYEYTRHNIIARRSKNIDFVEKFSKDERFLELKKQYQYPLNLISF